MQQNKVLHNGNLQCIQITAPHHPLQGQCLQVVEYTQRDGERQIVVRLPNGQTQCIPLRWTEPFPASPTQPLFSINSLRSLIKKTASLNPIPISGGKP